MSKLKTVVILSLLASVLGLFSSQALAHKVRIFAYGEGEAIVGEAAFSGGRAAKHSEILVQDAASNRTLHTDQTNDQGHFRFPIPAEAHRDSLDLRIIINAGEGHRAQWLLKAGEYLSDEGAEQVSNRDQQRLAEAVTPAGAIENNISADEERIRQVVEEALDKKLGPIKRLLAENQNSGPSLQDILGGIGYILGLAGIVCYFKSKQGEKQC